MSLFAQVRAYIDSLVHASARHDRSRPRAIARSSRRASSAACWRSPRCRCTSRSAACPARWKSSSIAWLATPILIACYLSRTGHYERAQIMSSVALTVLIAAIGIAYRRDHVVCRRLAGASFRSKPRSPRRAGSCWSRPRSRSVPRHCSILPAQPAPAPRRPRPPPTLMALGIVVGRALCHRARARQRFARARGLAPARGRGRPLSPARPQHRRRDHAPSPQRHRAVRLARGRDAVRRAGEVAARSRPVRPRPRRRPAGLSDGAGRCRRARRQQLGRVPHPARTAATEAESPAPVHLGRDALPPARSAEGETPKPSARWSR